eukprot:Em0003g424a
MCVVDGTSVPCSQGNIQVCPNAMVQVTSVNTEASSSNLWRLPQNSCPTKNPPDAIALTQGTRGVPSSCGTASSTCGAFTAQNNGSDPQSQLCLTSILTFNASSRTSFIRCGSGDVNNNYINSSDVASVNISITVTPGPPNGVTLVDGGNDTSLTVTWAPPTSGGGPTNYNASINSSTGTIWIIIPHVNGSSSYTLMFPGLTSNTLYSITVVAINCAGSSSNATLNNYTLAEPPSSVSGCMDPMQVGVAPLFHIKWSSVAGVLKYAYCISDSGVCNPTRNAQCSSSSCSDIENSNFNKDYTVCVASFNTGNYLGVPKCQILNNAKCSAGLSLHGCLFMCIVCVLVFVFIV